MKVESSDTFDNVKVLVWWVCVGVVYVDLGSVLSFNFSVEP
jgi:hypothetical protein